MLATFIYTRTYKFNILSLFYTLYNMLQISRCIYAYSVVQWPCNREIAKKSRKEECPRNTRFAPCVNRVRLESCQSIKKIAGIINRVVNSGLHILDTAGYIGGWRGRRPKQKVDCIDAWAAKFLKRAVYDQGRINRNGTR